MTVTNPANGELDDLTDAALQLEEAGHVEKDHHDDPGGNGWVGNEGGMPDAAASANAEAAELQIELREIRVRFFCIFFP